MITLSEEQNLAYCAINDFIASPKQIFVLHGLAGTGKAQPKTALIQTPFGPICMGDIQIGQEVLGANGKPTKVVAIHPQGMIPTYLVTFRDNTSTKCSGEHLWAVAKSKTGYRNKYTINSTLNMIGRNISNACGYKFKVPLCEPVEFDSEHAPYDPYTIGVLLGDGYIKGSVVAVSIADNEQEILQRIVSALPDGFEIGSNRKGSGCSQAVLVDTVESSTNRLNIHLQNQNLKIGSNDKFIPKKYLFAPINDRIDLLHGLMDSDGSIHKNRTSFSTSSGRLADDICFLIRSLGGVAVKRQCIRKTGKIDYSINVKVEFNPFYLPRKANSWKPSWKNPPSKYIKSIEQIEDTEQQCITVEAIDGLYLTDDFIITHNSTIVSQLAVEQSKLRTTELCAFTGKAASVLAIKASYEARTIHSLFYRLVEKGVDENGKRILKFQRVFHPESLKGSLILVDESSMINDSIGLDLKSSGAKIIACGDNGQLKPVQGKQYFTKPDFVLKQIHRQALESPIIRQAYSVRSTGTYKADGDNFRVTNQLTPDNLRDADTVLCWTNKTRVAFNEVIRELKGFKTNHPGEGETVMCLKNASDYGIFNGAIYTLARPFLPTDKNIYLDIDGNEVKVPNCVFVKPGETIDKYDNKKITSAFDFGFCVTVHKSQGSEWDSVILIDEYSRDDERREWLYTGITRAKTKILIQR